jgi:hypothetical protein
MVWSEICYGSNSPEHLQHIQKWSGKLFLKYIFGLERDHVMAVIVQNIHNTSKSGLGIVPKIHIQSGVKSCYEPNTD